MFCHHPSVPNSDAAGMITPTPGSDVVGSDKKFTVAQIDGRFTGLLFLAAALLRLEHRDRAALLELLLLAARQFRRAWRPAAVRHALHRHPAWPTVEDRLHYS